MEFEPGHLYHIFNRGNNSQKVFFTHDNYLFFLKKIKKHLLPHADILAWCLMPNHFHLMVHVNKVNVDVGAKGFTEQVAGFTEQVTALRKSNHDSHLHHFSENSHLLSKTGFSENSHLLSKTGFSENSHLLSKTGSSQDSHLLSKTGSSKTLSKARKTRSLNNSVGIVLRSYTRSIQKQQGSTGSLFQNRTKSICLTLPADLSPAWFQTSFGAVINVDLGEDDYPQVCFNYIHRNPVNGGLVKLPEQWEFSSALDYAGLRNGKLINRNRSAEFGLRFY